MINIQFFSVHKQYARRILPHSRSNARLFCSNTNETLWTSNETLHSQIESALHQKAKISTVLEQWRQQGNKLSPSIVRGILEKLRDSKQYPQALEVSQWMTEHKICSLVPEDYTTRFHLTEKVLGFKEADKFLKNLRNESGGKKDVDRADDVVKKMRELGLILKPSPLTFMMSLYISVGNRSKVDEVLREMNEKNVKLYSLDLPKTLENIRYGNKPITLFLEEWGKLGRNQVKPSELIDLIKNLQDSITKALDHDASSCQEVIGLCPEDYANLLNLTEKELGLKEAGEFFETSIPEKMKGESVYSTLLNMHTRSYQNVSKAEAIFEKMGELGFLSKLSPFKSMISLYSVLGKRVEIEKLLRKMKEKNIELDNVTMNNALSVRNKIGEMGNEEYISVVKSLLKLGDVQEMCGEWEQSSGGEEFDVQGAQEKSLVIYRYGEKGGEKIKMFMKDMMGVVLGICFLIAMFMILLAAANDRYLAFSLAMLWLCVSTPPASLYGLIYLFFLSR
ncbi:unnamed protein product [Eruca vesicaria subsp. sativa]|uniref:Pentatricopeptide repeat-containing protein n=1 Tax=Eruca vesicaria subsp. sativa TaxID=29727 RepID=A0ABC8IN34_ERUVS|nr:unnamed protein product [Eruca vesicaria subsp. sativa]